MNAMSMFILSLLHVHVLWYFEICHTFMLKILFVSSEMKLRDDTTPGLTVVNSNDNSALRNIVLPILIVLALLAISLAILYAFFKQFVQKRRENATETNQQVSDSVYPHEQIDC
jgi:hypothetical protein